MDYKKRPILVDVDGVLTNGFHEKSIAYINNKHNTNYELEQFTFEIRKGILEWNDEVEDFIKSPGFCSDFVPIESALKSIDKLKSMDFNIIYLTSPLNEGPTWAYDRLKWLEKHFGATRKDVIFANDKRYVDGIVLIDDKPSNVQNWSLYNKRAGILFNQPWNKKEAGETKYNFVDTEYACDFADWYNANNWEEVLSLLNKTIVKR